MGSFKEDKDEDYDLKKKMGFIMEHASLFTLQDHSHEEREEDVTPPPVSEEEEEEEGEGVE